MTDYLLAALIALLAVRIVQAELQYRSLYGLWNALATMIGELFQEKE